MIDPFVMIDDLHKFTARKRVYVACFRCETVLNRTVNAIRINLRRNGQFICHKCRNNDPDYIAAQKKSHPKTGDKWNSLINVNCSTCKKESTIRYRSLQSLNKAHKKHTCLSCANKKAHTDGKFRSIYTKEFLEQLNSTSDEFWRDNRSKWKTEYMGYLLDDPEYHTFMSECGKKPWKSDNYRKKMSQLNIDRWQDPEYREKMMAIYNKPEFKEKMAVVRASQSNRASSIQLQLYKYLDDLGVDYHKEGSETRMGYYVFDCLIPKQGEMHKHIFIECQGDYWHSLPKAIRNDKSKFTYIDRYFPEHEIAYVWEHEFSAKDRVLDRLKLKLGINIETVDFNFRDVQIKEVLSRDIKSFLDAYHYIGKGRGGKCFGAFHDNQLIACIVFSSPLRQNISGQFGLSDDDVVELSRLCIHPSYHKKNFASWLIGRTIKSSNFDKIVAYADTTVGHDGTIYKAANFRLHHEVAPDYWYVDGDGYVMHKKTLYGRARKMKMKESDFAEKYRYFKKWGGKKLCFVFG